MRKLAFDNDELWEVFRKELVSWIGTRYITLQKAKGIGADCCTYIAKCFEKTGIWGGCDYPKRRDRQWFLAEGPEANLIYLEFARNFEKYLNPKYEWEHLTEWIEYARGDILLFTIKKDVEVYTHCSIYLGNDEMIHNRERGSVKSIRYDDRWKKYCKGIFRVFER